MLQRVVKVFVDLFRFLGRFKVREVFPDFLYELIQNLNCHLRKKKNQRSPVWGGEQEVRTFDQKVESNVYNKGRMQKAAGFISPWNWPPN